MTAASNSEARKRAAEAASVEISGVGAPNSPDEGPSGSGSENGAQGNSQDSAPTHVVLSRENGAQHPVDSGAIGRLNEAQQRDLAAAAKRDEWSGEWNSLPAAVERILAARTARPEGIERVEWGVRHPQGIKECSSEKEAREAMAGFRRRSSIRVRWDQSALIRRVVGPWERVEEGDQ